MARESRGLKARRQIADLNASGFTNADIAREINRNRSTVGRWAEGQTSPRKGTGGALTRLWKRVAKVLGPGGTVNLTSFFRRVWVLDKQAILPLAIESLPTYSWPPNAAVSISAHFSDWVVDYGGDKGLINIRDKVLSSTFKGAMSMKINSTGEPEITDALLKALEAQKSYPVEYARIDFVLLRRGVE